MTDILSSLPPAASPAAGRKRSAESSIAPSLDKKTAAKNMKLLVPLKKPKIQSQFSRFKALILKDAKERGDAETVASITVVAKSEWAKVKSMNPSSVALGSSSQSAANSGGGSSSDVAGGLSDKVMLFPLVSKLLRLKAAAAKEEADEATMYGKNRHAWCLAFQENADAHLRWTAMETTEANVAVLEGAVKTVEEKLSRVVWDDRVPRGYLTALREAKEQIKSIKAEQGRRDLVDRLRNAPDEVLEQHAREHQAALEKARELLRVRAELDSIHAARRAEEERRRSELERDACTIKLEIARALKKQMVYSGLTGSSSDTSYRRGGVSLAVFAKAFGVPEGTKKATISSREVGTKPLRYRAWLESSDVTVKLIGEELTATAYYYLAK